MLKTEYSTGKSIIASEAGDVVKAIGSRVTLEKKLIMNVKNV